MMTASSAKEVQPANFLPEAGMGGCGVAVLGRGRAEPNRWPVRCERYATAAEDAERDPRGYHSTGDLGSLDADAQQVAALIVSSADHESLADAARARLSAFKLPTLWLVVRDAEQVPMTATGKVDKAALQQLLRSRAVRPISTR